MAHRFLRMALVLAILGGCNVQSSDATGPSKAPPPKKEQGFVLYPSIPSSRSAKAGTQHVDPETGAKLLKEICLDNRSDFTQAIDVIKKYPFVQNTKNGYFYHKDLHVSVDLRRDPPHWCSMSVRWKRNKNQRIFHAMKKWNVDRPGGHEFLQLPIDQGRGDVFLVKGKFED